MSDKKPGIVSVVGAAGGAFSVTGYNLGHIADIHKIGETKASVMIAGRAVAPTAWYTQDEDRGGRSIIKGRLPNDISKGEVVVVTPDGQTVKGELNTVLAPPTPAVHPDTEKATALAKENEELKAKLAEAEKNKK